MPELSSCPACGSSLSAGTSGLDRDARCATCAEAIPGEPADWNPYAPPSSAPIGGGEEPGRMLDVPPSMIGKIAFAFLLLGANLPLVVLIVLTLWLPANIAIESSLMQVPAEKAEAVSFRLNQIVAGAFGPIVLGALIFAIAGRMRGEKVGYFEAMGVGFRHWGRMFAARFYANLRILLGLIALIIPGVVLGVRYSLLEPAIILERPDDPRRRSTDLTLGRRWPIFFALAGFLAFDYVCGSATRSAFQWFEALDNFWAYVAADCLLDVVESLSTIILVLFYLEARQQESEETDREGHLMVDPGSWDLDGPAVALPGEFAR